VVLAAFNLLFLGSSFRIFRGFQRFTTATVGKSVIFMSSNPSAGSGSGSSAEPTNGNNTALGFFNPMEKSGPPALLNTDLENSISKGFIPSGPTDLALINDDKAAAARAIRR
jgi:hypothetical protein